MHAAWTHVSLFLPPALVDVLAVVFDPEIDSEPEVIMAYVDARGRWFMTPTGDALTSAIVSHWAPLPNLPKVR